MNENCNNCGNYLLDYYSKELRRAQYFNEPTPKLQICPFCGWDLIKNKMVVEKSKRSSISRKRIKARRRRSKKNRQSFSFVKFIFFPIYLPYLIIKAFMNPLSLIIIFASLIIPGFIFFSGEISEKENVRSEISTKLENYNLIDSSDDLEDTLSKYALVLINEDRAKSGLNKLILGNNKAAQIHADDAAKHKYVSHWMLNGEKPYQVYTKLGGDSYAFENAAGNGWSDADWEKENCNSYNVNCYLPSMEQTIKEAHFDFMYNDFQCCDNGHKDNILNPSHLKVNIGISIDEKERFVSFYQHFEGGHFISINRPNLSESLLDFKIENVTKEYKFSDGAIHITYDTLPEYLGDKNGNHPEKFNQYCTGGGYRLDNCDMEKYLFAEVLRPLSPNRFYTDLDSRTIIAKRWIESENFLEVQIDLSKKIMPDGIYTVIIFGDHIQSGRSDVLIELSVIKE